MELKTIYRSGRDNIGKDFIAPCLRVSKVYKRLTGSFSTSALVTWADALEDFINDDETEIQLVIAPILTGEEIQAIRESYVAREVLHKKKVRNFLEIAREFAGHPQNAALRLELFGKLLETGKLKLKFAFMEINPNFGDFHEKLGIFYQKNGNRIAFIGSANESLNSHQNMGELISVFSDEWGAESPDRRDEFNHMFEETWNDSQSGVKVYAPTEESIKLVVELTRKHSAAKKIRPSQPLVPPESRSLPLWKHQERALTAFLAEKRGILEMATGTGKTRTAIAIASKLLSQGQIESIIVATSGNDLLSQWHEDLREQQDFLHGINIFLRNFSRYQERNDYLVRPRGRCLIVSWQNLGAVVDGVPFRDREKILLVHDEVHGLGAPALVRDLLDSHEGFEYRLGLSATPDREYDDLGNDFISETIGQTIFNYSLEDGIRDGVLCEFDYVPLGYELTQGDKRRLQDVFKRKAARNREGKPMPLKEVYRELSRVYKTAELKPDVFESYVEKNKEVIKSCIVFVEDKNYGLQVLDLLHHHTFNYKTYFDDDESSYLHKFAAGELETLVTCHKLSQGIDIPELRSVVLFSSSRTKLETIQRIGRCLRRDPNRKSKKALVVDFIIEENDESERPSRVHADIERRDWLEKLSETRRSVDSGA